MDKKQLFENIKAKKSFLCVGLDTDIKKIPQHLLKEEDPIFSFNKAIIDATAPYCIAYKPNLAFYESMGVKGWISFEKTIKYLNENYPNHFIIADAKRGDIGNTSAMYARTFFEEMNIDSVTVGYPACAYKQQGFARLSAYSRQQRRASVRESSPPVTELGQRREHDVRCWRNTGQDVRGHPQGCSKPLPARSGHRRTDVCSSDLCKYGMNSTCGLIVNSSRAIIYADSTENFAKVAAEKAKEVQQQMEAELAKAGL